MKSFNLRIGLAVAIVASALGLGMSAALACSDKSDQANATTKQTPVPASATTAAFRVDGMMCAGCEGNLRTALNKLNGIYKVDVKMADKRVVVAFDKSKVTSESIAKAIVDAGFKASAEV
jgi:copper chaperone CopZ